MTGPIAEQCQEVELNFKSVRLRLRRKASKIATKKPTSTYSTTFSMAELKLDTNKPTSTKKVVLTKPKAAAAAKFLRGPGRREIGHGNLAERALKSSGVEKVTSVKSKLATAKTATTTKPVLKSKRDVILKKYHKGLGEKHDIVSVKPGFG